MLEDSNDDSLLSQLIATHPGLPESEFHRAHFNNESPKDYAGTSALLSNDDNTLEICSQDIVTLTRAPSPTASNSTSSSLDAFKKQDAEQIEAWDEAQYSVDAEFLQPASYSPPILTRARYRGIKSNVNLQSNVPLHPRAARNFADPNLLRDLQQMPTIKPDIGVPLASLLGLEKALVSSYEELGYKFEHNINDTSMSEQFAYTKPKTDQHQSTASNSDELMRAQLSVKHERKQYF